MAVDWKRAAVSTLLIVVATAVYWLGATLVSVLAFFSYFGDFGAGHGGDVAYMREMGHELAIGRWIAIGAATVGYCVIVAAIFRARWFRGR